LDSKDVAGWSYVREKLKRRCVLAGDAFVLNEVDVAKAIGRGLRFQPNQSSGTQVGHEVVSEGRPGVFLDIPLLSSRLSWDVERLGVDSPSVSPEELTAASMALDREGWKEWGACIPRSFSVLPIREACQAACPFCFSHASISSEPLGVSGAKTVHWEEGLVYWSQRARSAGATRAVLTGGGEPLLLPRRVLEQTLRTLQPSFSSILLITNGLHPRATEAEFWHALESMGLTTVALSRHGLDDCGDARLMGLDCVPTAPVMAALRKTSIRLRKITVLQKNGVRSSDDVLAAIRRAAEQGFTDVCFKELYVAALSESLFASAESNRYSKENQVSLSVVLEAMEAVGAPLISRLPWGAPVFDYEGVRVAAYTEPSIAWERSSGLVRSWNYMADGQCFASLETMESRLQSPTSGRTSRHIPIIAE